MKSLAIIPGRGGSKRIPNKNKKDFLGKPIIAYSIETALNSNLFETVMVSTDDDEIEQIAVKLGAVVPFKRSKKNSDDFATTVDVLLEVLEEYENIGKRFDSGCLIYPTAPFITAEQLIKGQSLLQDKKYDCVFPVLPFSYPIQRALKIADESKMEMYNPENLNVRSQDLETAYHDSGQFYWFNVDAIKSQQKLWTNNSGVMVISELQAQDIDSLDDWKLAELKYRLLNE